MSWFSRASIIEHEAIAIRDGAVLWGSLPKRALGLVEEWRRAHVVALEEDWERARGRRPTEPDGAVGVGMPRLEEARYIRDCVLWVRFSDGSEGEVDLAGELEGEVFEPLRDRAYFRGFSVHPELHAVTWPNGADFAPEFLYERLRVHA